MQFYICRICDENIVKQAFKTHLSKHGYTKEKYYDEFIRESEDEGYCLNCKKKLKLEGLKYKKFCSCKCSAMSDQTKNLRKDTNLKLFGAENPFQSDKIKDKIKYVNLQRYGVENPSQSKELQNKKKKTWTNHYGVDHPFKSDIIQEKIKNSFNKKYGVDNFMQSKEFLKKSKKTWKNKYKTDNPHKNKEIINKTKETCINKYGVNCPIHQEKYLFSKKKQFYDSLFFDRLQHKLTPLFDMVDFKGVKQNYQFSCNICGNVFKGTLKYGTVPRCLICEPYKYSKSEIEISDYVKKFYTIDKNTRNIISPYELDIYIPEKKLAIEFDGLYWHSEQQGKDRKYHLNKTLECEKKGIRLIHIFEDEWKFKKKIVKNRLKNILGLTKYKIYGRKCIIKTLDSKTCKKFIDKYHIQGNSGSSVKLGLFYKNRLVAVMTFGKRRVCMGKKTTEEGEFELLRYCTVANFNVIGGAGKLLKYFERNYNPSKITSYADRRWSQGNLYFNLGFEMDHISQPNYWYVENGLRKHRFNFRKNLLLKKLTSFDEKLTEYQNMLTNGYDRIWDCGNYVFEKNYPT